MEMASLVITSEKKNVKKSATMDHVLMIDVALLHPLNFTIFINYDSLILSVLLNQIPHFPLKISTLI